MLVLKRKNQQSIIIDGGKIVIRVLHCTHESVTLGIQAADEITIDRGEVHHEKLKQKERLTDDVPKSSTDKSET